MNTAARQSPAASAPTAGTGLRRANLFFALVVGLLVALDFGVLLGWREFGQAEALLEVAAGARGYALSGTPDFLELYDAGRTAVALALVGIRRT